MHVFASFRDKKEINIGKVIWHEWKIVYFCLLIPFLRLFITTPAWSMPAKDKIISICASLTQLRAHFEHFIILVMAQFSPLKCDIFMLFSIKLISFHWEHYASRIKIQDNSVIHHISISNEFYCDFWTFFAFSPPSFAHLHFFFLLFLLSSPLSSHEHGCTRFYRPTR